MLWISHCQGLKGPLRCSTRLLAQPIRPLSQTSALRVFLRPTPCLRQEVPSFRDKIGPAGYNESFYEKAGKPGIKNQIIFVVVGSILAFGTAAYITTADTRDWRKRMMLLSSVWASRSITNEDMKRAQASQFLQDLRNSLNEFSSTISNYPLFIRNWTSILTVAVMQTYADVTEGKRLCWKICLLNIGVWAAWKIRRLQPFMVRSFMHNPLSGMSYTLVTSMFSHMSFLHLLFNCMALESFGAAAYSYLNKEQDKFEPQQRQSTSSYHFLAFFVSAGMFSGLVSHIVASKFHYPRFIAKHWSTLNAEKKGTWAAAATGSSAVQAAAPASKEILPSLGASGAVYAAVTMTALAFPEAQLALFFPPSYPIDIQVGVGGLMMIDVIGILRGWRTFDHWAHLGGAAFGIAYYNFGPRIWHRSREIFTETDEK